MFNKAVCFGRISTDNIKDNLDNKIKKGSIMLTDGETAYRKFAKEQNIKLKQFKEGKSYDSKYHIQNINNYHCSLKGFMIGFKGVATKYLDNYLCFYKIAKSLKNNMFNELAKRKGYITIREMKETKLQIA